MTAGRSNTLAWWSAMTILVSAFLLFQVQPVISKTILPWFGGSPAVWTTCVLFFQLLLLGGYAYAHVLIRYVPSRWQGMIHAVLLVLALFTLPITPADYWKPNDGNLPELRILFLLAAKVGAPYFLLSSTGPLVQAWFAQLYPGRTPYRLYALSNIGSLAALLSYPFLFEVNLNVRTQGLLWSLGFVGFAVLVGYLAITMWKQAVAGATAAGSESGKSFAGHTEASKEQVRPPSIWLRIGWLALAALPSVGLLSITHHLSQDISPNPFMWVIPLSLYLLSFIICFDSDWWYQRRVWAPLAILGIFALTAINNGAVVRSELAALAQPAALTKADPPKWHSPVTEPVQEFARNTVMPPLATAAEWIWDRVMPSRLTNWFDDNVRTQSAMWLAILFLICMVCHGELVRSKPQPQYLTSFYLYLSAGGALGGLFVALVCPLIFKLHFELALTVLGGFIVGWIALANDGRASWLKGREILQWSAAFLIVGGILLVAKGNVENIEGDTILTARNFYGTISVKRLTDEEDPSVTGLALYNGRIWHGFQYDDPARKLEPTTYYIGTTGVALAVHQHPRHEQPLRVAVIGLGTGSLAAHGKAGDLFRFYDIDPKVKDVAENTFTYLADSPADTEVILGDARISLERELNGTEGGQYDVIVLDAFSGDAIPAHLLTDESFETYHRHLRRDGAEPMGVIAIHISNRYLDLEPVVAAIAKKHGYMALLVHTAEGLSNLDTGSDWVLVTQNQEFLHNSAVAMLGKPLAPKQELLWTDQRTSLWPILQQDEDEARPWWKLW